MSAGFALKIPDTRAPSCVSGRPWRAPKSHTGGVGLVRPGPGPGEVDGLNSGRNRPPCWTHCSPEARGRRRKRREREEAGAGFRFRQAHGEPPCAPYDTTSAAGFRAGRSARPPSRPRSAYCGAKGLDQAANDYGTRFENPRSYRRCRGRRCLALAGCDRESKAEQARAAACGGERSGSSRRRAASARRGGGFGNAGSEEQVARA